MVKILSNLLSSERLLLVLLVETTSLITVIIASAWLVNHVVVSGALELSRVKISSRWSSHHSNSLILQISLMNRLLLTKVLSSIESWVVEMIILIRKNRSSSLLHLVIVRTILLSHNIVGRHLTLVTHILLCINWIKLALTLLKHHTALVKIVIITLVIFVDCVERVSVRLLISLTSFVATSLLIHLLMVLIINVICSSTATHMASLAIVLGCERITVSTSASVISTKVAWFSTLHLILDELFLHLVLILDDFHFLLE